jgi:peptidoglycan/xylan/chitin deacetylase (PgdA/CDA1 family)
VTFYINPYSPQSREGKATIAVSKTLLKNIINDQYVQPDSEKQTITEQSVQYRIAAQPPRGDTINPAGKLIALTFDDGPGNLTPQVLDVLDMYQSHATFFVLGHLASTYASTLQRTVREGNEIGNHSWNHPNLRLFSAAGLDGQILATQNAIQAATGGYTPVLMRPPYGFTNPVVRQYLGTHHLTEALWNADTNDWKDRNAQVVYDRIMGDARDGRVILMHDIHPTSAQAAVRAIRDLKAQGYQLVTLSQLYRYR